MGPLAGHAANTQPHEEVSIAELCRKEGIQENAYYKGSNEFLEAGRKAP
jgi:hypothetical protein